MTNKEFIEKVYEITFGDDAINRDFSKQEVLDQLREFSDKALEVEDLTEALQESENELDCCSEKLEIAENYEQLVEDMECLLDNIVKEIENFNDYGIIPSEYNDKEDMLTKIAEQLDELSTDCYKALQGV